MPLVSLTRATLRSAEFGFFGVVVYTRVHTPRRCGLPLRAAVFCLATLSSRPLRTSCWIVGIDRLSPALASRAHSCRTQTSVYLVPPYPEVGRVARLRTRAGLNQSLQVSGGLPAACCGSGGQYNSLTRRAQAHGPARHGSGTST